jgi:hypothetical protein
VLFPDHDEDDEFLAETLSIKDVRHCYYILSISTLL